MLLRGHRRIPVLGTCDRDLTIPGERGTWRFAHRSILDRALVEQLTVERPLQGEAAACRLAEVGTLVEMQPPER